MSEELEQQNNASSGILGTPNEQPMAAPTPEQSQEQERTYSAVELLGQSFAGTRAGEFASIEELGNAYINIMGALENRVYAKSGRVLWDTCVHHHLLTSGNTVNTPKENCSNNQVMSGSAKEELKKKLLQEDATTIEDLSSKLGITPSDFRTGISMFKRFQNDFARLKNMMPFIRK